MKRIHIWLLVLFALALGACAEVGATDIGLKYGQGPMEGEHFEEIVEPGSGQKFVWNDKIVTLPITQREYTFCAEVRQDANANGCDAPPIRVTARGGAEIAISGGVTFELNTDNRIKDGEDKSPVQQFYEDVCRKFNCDDESEGWAEMLRVNMRNPLEDSLQEAARRYSVDAIYAGVPGEGDDIGDDEALSTLTQVSNDIETSLRATINAFMGGQFFCGPGYDRADPDNCPDFEFVITEVAPVSDAVKSAFDKNVASRQAVTDAQNRAEAQRVEAQGIKEAQDALAGSYSDPAWLAYERIKAERDCANNNNCVLIIGGGDSANVNVTPRG